MLLQCNFNSKNVCIISLPIPFVYLSYAYLSLFLQTFFVYMLFSSYFAFLTCFMCSPCSCCTVYGVNISVLDKGKWQISRNYFFSLSLSSFSNATDTQNKHIEWRLFYSQQRHEFAEKHIGSAIYSAIAVHEEKKWPYWLSILCSILYY